MIDDLIITHTWKQDPEDHNFWVCPSCGSEAYWDADYGQQLFDFCPYCGEDLRTNKRGKRKL